MSKQKSATTAKHFDDLPGSARVGSDVARVIFDVKALSTLWRWEKEGRLPPSKKVAGSRFKSWSAGELRAVLNGGVK
ncbi:MAG: transcriptional regulator [Betaproteobacteria bacterium]|nr:transcriptional regulator [Betaproteobacteria bacterium]